MTASDGTASLRGRTALITGATGCLGRAIATRYAAAGARLIVTGRESDALAALDRELAAAQAAASVVPCDLERPVDVERLVDEVRRRIGRFDILVNAAAVIGPIGPTWDVDWEGWRRSVDTNLFAAVRLCQLCVPLMPAGGRAKIINLSGGGATSARPRFSAYAAAKSALVRFSETLAAELRDAPFDVNCIAPGIMASTLTRAVVDAGPQRAGAAEYDAAMAAITADADGRQRAADLALFLASASSDGISGRLLSAVWDDWRHLRARVPPLDDPAMYTLRRVVPTAEAPMRADGAPPLSTPLSICVAGLWHLGCVTAACAADAGHQVVAYDDSPRTVADLAAGSPPIAEPGLADLIGRAAAGDRLAFTADPAAAAGADVVWITWDTPIDDEDRADHESVLARAAALFPHIGDHALVIVSSQLPVGSVADLERRFRAVRPAAAASFACIPENLRLGDALRTFMTPDRIVVGIRDDRIRPRMEALLAPFTRQIEWMGVESAEMTKHTLNAFLATSVAFINEIASLCELVGADAAEVARGVKSDLRIGPRAYLTPGRAFAGGTLARDIRALTQLAAERGRPIDVIAAVRSSNDRHRGWIADRLRAAFGSLRGRTIAVWGLTYKPGTDTLRRSDAIALCELLAAEGATVRAFDPAVAALPPPLNGRVTLAPGAAEAARGADALVIATEWPEFLSVVATHLTGTHGGPLVIDPNGFTAGTLGRSPGLRYVTVGRP